MRKFWNFSENETNDETENILKINGYIAEESWFDEATTPKQFEAELKNIKGKLTVFINSGGGDCFAAGMIYTMLREHSINPTTGGKITVKIDGIAASAASVIAMAGDEVLVSPTAILMIHNPASLIFGEVADLEQGIEMLLEVKETIINAYELKTKLPRAKISKLMDAETWMSAKKAIGLGFADGMLYDENEENTDLIASDYAWNNKTSALAVVNAMRKKLPKKQSENIKSEDKIHLSGECKTSIDSLFKRLSLLK